MSANGCFMCDELDERIEFLESKVKDLEQKLATEKHNHETATIFFHGSGLTPCEDPLNCKIPWHYNQIKERP